MEKFPKSSGPRTALPPDIAALLSAENSRMDASERRAEDTTLQIPPTHSFRYAEPQRAPQTSDTAPRSAASSATSTPPPTNTFRPVNPKKPTPKKVKLTPTERPLAPLAPAPPRFQQLDRGRLAQQQQQQQSFCNQKHLLALPAEIRVEIYRLVLENVTLHILPLEARLERRAPHALTRVCKLVRNEVLPIIHASCPIEAMVTDFNFNGMLEFINRIPPQDQKALLKNDNLKIQLCTTGDRSKSGQQIFADPASLRRWLQHRADQYKVQPRWEYCGVNPGRKVESEMRRKISRMSEEGKKRELIKLASSIGLERLEKQPRP